MNIKSLRKIIVLSVLLLLLFAVVSFSSCSSDSKENENIPKSNITAEEAWPLVESGFNKTAAATGYNVTYKTDSNSVFMEHSNKETSEHTISIYAIGTPDFTADAKSEFSDTKNVNHYYFDSEKFYKLEKSDKSSSTPYLYVSDDIDVLEEVTGLNVFEINMDKAKSVMKESKSIVKGEENGLQYIRFAMTSQNAVDIFGEAYHVFNGMKNFKGFIFFYIDNDGYLVKFGYDSSYSEESEDGVSAIELKCEYTFSDIDKTEKILAPSWVTKLQPEEFDTVYYIKDKILYAFFYEESESTNGYGYKLYWLESVEDERAVVKFADVPDEINGVKITDISRTMLVFGKGAEVLVLPETINYLPYPAEGVNATIFSKCNEFVEDIPEGVTAYTAGEWEYVNGVPTVK